MSAEVSNKLGAARFPFLTGLLQGALSHSAMFIITP